jgi:hypothetical protein
MSRTPRRYDAEQVRRFSDTTIAYYDRFAWAFWNGTRDHHVSQNYAAFLGGQGATIELAGGQGPKVRIQPSRGGGAATVGMIGFV